MKEHKYRVRRGLWGTSVLQKLDEINMWNTPYYIGRPYFEWRDVRYVEAPSALTTEISK